MKKQPTPEFISAWLDYELKRAFQIYRIKEMHLASYKTIADCQKHINEDLDKWVRYQSTVNLNHAGELTCTIGIQLTHEGLQRFELYLEQLNNELLQTGRGFGLT